MTRQGKSRVDAVELGVFAHLLASIAEEVGTALCRSAASPNIKERRDFSAALFDARGTLLAQAAHIPVHLGSAAISVRAAIRARPMRPGDAVLLNDPYAGGTHLPDITLVTPVFLADGEAPAYHVATRAHHADVGGSAPGSMVSVAEIYQEGLRIPPVHLRRENRWNADVLDLLLLNVRTPGERRADLEAQVAANDRGATRLRELVDRYGRPRVDRAASALLDYTARLMAATLRGLPDGEYSFADHLDGDGRGGGPYPIRVRITIRGTRARFDFAGTHPQVPGSVNANRAVTTAAVFYCLRCLLDGEVPTNEGVMRPVELQLPAASLVDARPPAAVAGGNVETSQRIVDVVLGALAAAAPDRIPAASQGTMNNLTIGGVDPRTGEAYTYYETIPGGSGAGPWGRGTSGVQSHMTNTLNTPVEALEHAYPLEVECTRLRTGSGGRGRARGGDGVVRAIRVRGDAQVGLLTERRTLRPYGLAGGEPGRGGRDWLVSGGRRRAVPGKGSFGVGDGDTVRIETPGGGGFGRARKR
jgi:N-methylhydantoinase B